jgi:hypothetical protein
MADRPSEILPFRSDREHPLAHALTQTIPVLTGVIAPEFLHGIAGIGICLTRAAGATP